MPLYDRLPYSDDEIIERFIQWRLNDSFYNDHCDFTSEKHCPMSQDHWIRFQARHKDFKFNAPKTELQSILQRLYLAEDDNASL